MPHARDRRRLAGIALLVSTLALLFGPGLAEYVRYAADPWHFNDDARQQIWPFLRYADPALFQNDYLADYFLATFPRGYRLLYEIAATGLDPRTFSKVLPLVGVAVVLGCLVASAWRLAGPSAAWATGALCLSADVYLGRMSGGLPRAFAFPLVALAVFALVRGKPLWLAAAAVLGAAFYFPIAALLSFTTAAYLFLIPPSWQGEARTWSWRRRIVTLAATALAATIVAMPAVVAGRAYGRLIGRGDVDAYPEAWVGGRYDKGDLPLPELLKGTVVFYAEAPILSGGPPWDGAWRNRIRDAIRSRPVRAVSWTVIFIGSVSLFVENVAARRLASLIVGAFALYAVALAAWPRLYFPARSLTYALPLLTPLVLPAAIGSLAARWKFTRPPTVRAAVVIGSVVSLLVVLGARGPGRAGIRIDVGPEMRPLYESIARLPPSSLIAGWPDDTIDNVPYLTGRRILLGFEVHQALHTRFADEMRRRMQALIDAYFANDAVPLRRLREEFGVTHLLVDREHYGRHPPRYFEPFDATIAAAIGKLRAEPETLRQAPAAEVFEAGSFLLLDLSRVADR